MERQFELLCETMQKNNAQIVLTLVRRAFELAREAH